MTQRKLVGLFASALASIPQSVVAREVISENEPVATRIVAFSYSDIASESGMTAIERRLRVASRLVCKEEYPRADYLVRTCSRASYEDAAAQVARLKAKGFPAQAALPLIAIAISAR